MRLFCPLGYLQQPGKRRLPVSERLGCVFSEDAQVGEQSARDPSPPPARRRPAPRYAGAGTGPTHRQFGFVDHRCQWDPGFHAPGHSPSRLRHRLASSARVYAVQVLELAPGQTPVAGFGLNMRDGLKRKGRLPHDPASRQRWAPIPALTVTLNAAASLAMDGLTANLSWTSRAAPAGRCPAMLGGCPWGTADTSRRRCRVG